MAKRILMVRSIPNDLDIKGYNLQQIGLGKAFCDKGYDFDFITFKKNSNDCKSFIFYENKGCKARYIEKPRLRFLRWGINFEITTEKFLRKYDFIICQEYYQIESYLISRHTNKMVLYSGPYYNLFMPKFFSPLYDKFIGPRLNRNVRHIFVKSVLAQQFLEQKGYDGLYNIGVGLDTSRFNNVSEIHDSTMDLMKYMQDNKCILYVGALSDRKNIPFLLETYKKVLEKDPSIKFVMIGRSIINPLKKLIGKKDEDYERECMSKMPQNVRDGVYRIRRIENSQLKYIYPLAKALLLPSKLEIFGMVLLEAMYLRTPVVTSYNGGSMTLIDKKNTGIMLKNFNSDEWCESIMKLINNKEYSEEIKNNAEKIVRDEYNWSVIADKFLKISNII